MEKITLENLLKDVMKMMIPHLKKITNSESLPFAVFDDSLSHNSNSLNFWLFKNQAPINTTMKELDSGLSSTLMELNIKQSEIEQITEGVQLLLQSISFSNTLFGKIDLVKNEIVFFSAWSDEFETFFDEHGSYKG